MSETSDNECTLPELRQKAGEIVKNLFPEKSKTKYNKAYKIYMDWCNKHWIRKYFASIFCRRSGKKSRVLSKEEIHKFNNYLT